MKLPRARARARPPRAGARATPPGPPSPRAAPRPRASPASPAAANPARARPERARAAPKAGAGRALAPGARAPFEGLGKPEALRFDLAGCWSRRIDHEHRLVYTFDGAADTLVVLQCRYHY
nr:Txe/YoeB family addiction module toxin [Desulfocurvus vexinensis]